MNKISSFIIACLLFFTASAQTKSVQFSAALENKYAISSDSADVYLYLKVTGNELKSDKKRAPLNLSIVLDRSGSMHGEKLEYAKKAAAFVVEQLNADDIVSIVDYDSDVEVVSASDFVKNKQVLTEKINKILDRGSTNLSGGLLEGYKQVLSTKKEGFVNRVLLLSDGLANVGITDTAKLKDLVQQKFKETGISVSTFGLGEGFNEDLMTAMAENGGGNYYYIDSPDKIPGIFAKELDGLLSVVAQQAKISVSYASEFLIPEKTYGYNHKMENMRLLISLNDVYSKEEKNILVKFKIKKPFVQDLVFTSTLNYIDAQSYNTENIVVVNTLHLTRDTILIKQNLDSTVSEMVVMFEATEMMDDIMRDIDQGNYTIAASKMEKVSGFVNANQSKDKTGKINKVKSNVDKYKEDIKDIDKKNVYEKSKIQKSTKSNNYNIKKSK
ncbi:MAG TPA: VWA domain-containing protein [Chitinophagales bacterium]|nr:VWA domain-containing protein [Chitinophagales bacterium]HNL84201.1 VWA domain-containing protein [Chitinophagales bacterium]